jgi:hypothetical protein
MILMFAIFLYSKSKIIMELREKENEKWDPEEKKCYFFYYLEEKKYVIEQWVYYVFYFPKDDLNNELVLVLVN